MEFIAEEIQNYAEKHTSAESDLLTELLRENLQRAK